MCLVHLLGILRALYVGTTIPETQALVNFVYLPNILYSCIARYLYISSLTLTFWVYN